MRSRVLLAVSLAALLTGTALADTSGSEYATADSSGSGFSFSLGGLLAAGGVAGLAAGLATIFHNHSTGAQATVSTIAAAPEISTSGEAAGCALMLGGTLVARGRRRRQ